MKSPFYWLILSVLLHVACNGLAQEPDRCSTLEYLKLLEQKDSSITGRLAKNEVMLQSLVNNSNKTHTAQERIVPVVIHLIWHNKFENLCDDIVRSQIDVLNEDYGRLNADTINTPAEFKNLGEDSQIRFVLANRDPAGNVTTGIIRSYYADTFNFGSDMKYDSTGGQNQWDPDQYLNIWVCNLQGSVLGYATLPGSSNAGEDGIVISTRAFGRNSYDHSGKYNQGRTATHEIGHWLNLIHIWGDDDSCNGGDGISDTPNQAEATYGCPDFPVISCQNGPEGNMFMNYMDYTDDKCMNIFTKKQILKMQFALDSLRTGILSSSGYVPDSSQVTVTTNHNIMIAPNPFQTSFTISLKLKKLTALTVEVFDLMGKLLFEKNVNYCFCENYEVNMQTFDRGIYFVRVKTDSRTLVTKLFLSK